MRFHLLHESGATQTCVRQDGFDFEVPEGWTLVSHEEFEAALSEKEAARVAQEAEENYKNLISLGFSKTEARKLVTR